MGLWGVKGQGLEGEAGLHGQQELRLRDGDGLGLTQETMTGKEMEADLGLHGKSEMDGALQLVISEAKTGVEMEGNQGVGVEMGAEPGATVDFKVDEAGQTLTRCEDAVSISLLSSSIPKQVEDEVMEEEWSSAAEEREDGMDTGEMDSLQCHRC